MVKFGFGRFFIVSLVFQASIAIAADQPDCAPAQGYLPKAPEVGRDIKKVQCADSAEFRQSCAYENFLASEQGRDADAKIQAFVEQTGRAFDPSSTFTSDQADYGVLQAAFQNPNFLRMYTAWKFKSEGSEGNILVNGVNVPFSRVMNVIRKVDTAGILRSELDLLRALPDDGGAKSSPAEKKALLEKIYSQGKAYRQSHSVGCPVVTATVVNRSAGYTPFGLSVGENERLPVDRAEEAKAIAASQATVEASRSISGVIEKLQACGKASADVFRGEGAVLLSCDVDLPANVFPDNEPDLSKADDIKLAAVVRNNECYQKNLKNGLKIQKVEIATSANTLHNTKNYCKWEFDRLSADRGKSIQSALTRVLGGESVGYKINSHGSNGDGTSGPCAYIAKERKGPAEGAIVLKEVIGGKTRTRYFTEERDPRYASSEAEKALEPFKFARTTIYFEDKPIPGGAHKKGRAASTTCSEVRFDCK